MDTITKAVISGPDVDNFIQATLLPVVEGKPFDLVAASFITLLLSSMGPEDMTGDELVAGIAEVSSSLTLYLSMMRVDVAQAN